MKKCYRDIRQGSQRRFDGDPDRGFQEKPPPDLRFRQYALLKHPIPIREDDTFNLEE